MKTVRTVVQGLLTDFFNTYNPYLRIDLILVDFAAIADATLLRASTYELVLARTIEDASAMKNLDITSDITIGGNEGSETIIDANSLNLVFDVCPETRLRLEDES